MQNTRVITLKVNGKRREISGPQGLLAFIEEQGLKERRIAIGLNGEVVHRDRWGEIVLKDGDVLDIVQMVGGG